MREVLFKKIQEYLDEVSLPGRQVKDVYDFVYDKYVEQGREKFLSELLDIVLPIKPDLDTLNAALLCDLFGDEMVSEKKVKQIAGHNALAILYGVIKLKDLVSSLNYDENDKAVQVEVLRKMLLAMAKDVRVIMLGLCCRLYKMRNIDMVFVSEKEKRNFANKTMGLLVPAAARLGMYTLKSELEDLAFKYIKPRTYKEIVLQLDKLRKSCDLSINYIKKQLVEFLEERGVKADVSGRLKNVYSIYVKQRKKGLSRVEDLYDVFAMRIILKAEFDEHGKNILDKLYAVLGLIHSEWKPISKRFKDYLAVPKSNGYRSLHTVVLGLAPKDSDQPVEIQIRDDYMHREAEYGVASHWAYKDTGGKHRFDGLQQQIDWLRGLEQIRDEINATTDSDIVSEVDIDIFRDRIFVLTPRGEVKDLPTRSCPIDFAYSIHTDVGNHCVLAKVNGSIVPLDYELQNGDVVEITTRKDSAPKLQWLSLVQTNFARNKIKSYFSSLNRENNIKDGRVLINNQLSRIGKPKLDSKFSVLRHIDGRQMSLAERERVVGEVGSGAKSAIDIVRKVYPYEDSIVDRVVVYKKPTDRKGKGIDDRDVDDQILVGGESGLPIKLAACCSPKIGDMIVGYVTRGNSITIHRASCLLLDGLDYERFVFAEWKGLKGPDDSPKYLVGIKILAVPRVGLLSDITRVISSQDVDIKDVSLKKVKGGMTEEYFLLEIEDIDTFDRVVDKIENISGVFKVVKDDKFKIPIEREDES